ncbi:MAG: hypothetical protein GF333_02235 [Candidatus Omnitrophica bacterium]|nr:hypothetical protein [Candidatus Omnitrophota bacterium]
MTFFFKFVKLKLAWSNRHDVGKKKEVIHGGKEESHEEVGAEKDNEEKDNKKESRKEKDNEKEDNKKEDREEKEEIRSSRA